MAAADYWSQAQLDPAYLAAHGGNSKAIINTLLGYGDASSAFARPEGIDPATGQPYKTIAENYNFGQGDVAAAAGNPYSVQAQLAQQLGADRYGITNAANAHGVLFSGANAAAQAHETQNAGQRNYNAQQALGNQLAGIGQNDTNSLTGAYNTIATNALNTPTPAAPVVNAPGSPASIPGYTPPPAEGALTMPGYATQGPQNRGTGGLTPIRPPKIPTIKTGLQGHL